MLYLFNHTPGNYLIKSLTFYKCPFRTDADSDAVDSHVWTLLHPIVIIYVLIYQVLNIQFLKYIYAYILQQFYLTKNQYSNEFQFWIMQRNW